MYPVCKRIVVWMCLSVCCATVASAQESPRRFWTAAGPEPAGHDVDLDLGNRREFFQTDSKVWVERFADGFLVVFQTTGTDAMFGFTGKVAGQVIKSTVSNLQYFIPDQIKPGSVLGYRLSDSSQFLSASQIVPMEPDDGSSRFYIQAAVNLGKVRDAIYSAIPATVNENGDPNADEYRYRFDALTDPHHRQIGIVNNRIVVAQVFSGDFETKRFLGGCHLRPLYVEADLDFAPGITQTGENWIVSPQDPHVTLRLLPGSDTGCSIANINVTNKVNDALGRQSLKDKAVNAINRAAVSVPVSDVWGKVQGPLIHKLDQQTVCVYPRPSAVWVGNLRGTFDAAAIDIAIFGAPQIILSASCAPRPLVALKVLDADKPGPFPHVVSDILIPYSRVHDTILASASVKNAGIDDVVVESHQAYMTLKFHKHSGETVIVNAIPTVPVPVEEGSVGVDFVFADVPGAPGGEDLSAFSGSYSTDLTSQIDGIRKAVTGDFSTGSLKLSVSGSTMRGLLLTCESDGLHAYLDLELVARMQYLM